MLRTVSLPSVKRSEGCWTLRPPVCDEILSSWNCLGHECFALPSVHFAYSSFRTPHDQFISEKALITCCHDGSLPSYRRKLWLPVLSAIPGLRIFIGQIRSIMILSNRTKTQSLRNWYDQPKQVLAQKSSPRKPGVKHHKKLVDLKSVFYQEHRFRVAWKGFWYNLDPVCHGFCTYAGSWESIVLAFNSELKEFQSSRLKLNSIPHQMLALGNSENVLHVLLNSLFLPFKESRLSIFTPVPYDFDLPQCSLFEEAC